MPHKFHTHTQVLSYNTGFNLKPQCFNLKPITMRGKEWEYFDLGLAIAFTKCPSNKDQSRLFKAKKYKV